MQVAACASGSGGYGGALLRCRVTLNPHTRQRCQVRISILYAFFYMFLATLYDERAHQNAGKLARTPTAGSESTVETRLLVSMGVVDLITMACQFVFEGNESNFV
jgi:hypothetical protein